LQKHALAIRRPVIAKPGPNLRRREIEIGLHDLDTIDARYDRIVGSGGGR
jgi:hypothetical protein